MTPNKADHNQYFFRVFCLGIMLIVIMVFSPESTALYAQPIQVYTSEEPTPIASQIQFLLEDGDYTIDAISSAALTEAWQSYDKEFFTKRASEQALWFKINAQNLSDEDIWLEAGGGIACWEIDFYAPDSLGNYGLPLQTGSMRPLGNKAYPSNYYWLPLAKAGNTQEQTYYVRIQSQLTKEHPLYIGSIRTLSQKEKNSRLLAMVFVGIILGMFCYNLFLWYATKDNIYFRYICYLAMAGFQSTFVNNFPLIEGQFLYTYYLIWNDLLVFTVTFFAIGYLRLKTLLPKAYNAVWALTAFILLGVVLLNFVGVPLSKMATIYNVALLMLASLVIGIGGYLWAKGHRHARLFVMGWVFALIGLFVTILTIYGIVPRTLFSRSAMYFGFGFEAILFSLALADRLNRMEREKQEMQEENFKLIANQNKVLEEKVEQRTQEVVTQNEELQQQQEEVIAQRDFIEHQNEQLHQHNLRITDSIRYAQTIQEASLPSEEKMHQKLKEYFIVYLPKDIVSGDFYWVIEAHDSIYVAIGDCTGHGVPGAFMSIIGLSLLNEIVLGNEAVTPKEILTALNEKVSLALRQEQTANRDGMDISICRLTSEGENTKVVFAGAKTSIYYQSPKQSSIQQVKGDRKSLGGSVRAKAKKTVFTDHELLLPPQTMLYMATDGLSDQGNSQGRKIGTAALKLHLASNAHQPLQVQHASVMRLLEEHKKSAEQRDDITILGIKL